MKSMSPTNRLSSKEVATLEGLLDIQQAIHQERQGIALLFPSPLLARTGLNSPTSLIRHVKSRLGEVLLSAQVSDTRREEWNEELNQIFQLCAQPNVRPDLVLMEIDHLVSSIRSGVDSKSGNPKKPSDRKKKVTLVDSLQLARVPQEYTQGKEVSTIPIEGLRDGDRFLLVDSGGRWFVLQWEDEISGSISGEGFECTHSSVKRAVGSKLTADDFEERYGMAFRKKDTLVLTKGEVNISPSAYSDDGKIRFWDTFKTIRKLDRPKEVEK